MAHVPPKLVGNLDGNSDVRPITPHKSCLLKKYPPPLLSRALAQGHVKIAIDAF
jgi:hypothetical protein